LNLYCKLFNPGTKHNPKKYVSILMRILLWLLAPICLAALHGSLCAQNRELLAELKIGIIGRDLSDPAYQAAHTGALDAAKVLSKRHSIDVEVLVLTPKLADGQTQSSALGELFIEGADGFIISPELNREVNESIRFAVEEGQKVVVFESLQPLKSALMRVIVDEKEAGRQAGEAILPHLPTRGRIAILTSTQPSEADQARLKGLRNALGYKRIERIVACEPNYKSAIEAIQLAEKEDRNHLIKGWVFLDDWPLRGAPALPWRAGRLPCVSIQSTPSAFAYLDNGYLSAFVTHPYYEWGYRSIETLVQALFLNRPPEKPTLVLKTQVINWDNVEEYREEWRNWLN
jgi:ribose transport system substrate-binding protein